ncbi:hypothetical protein [Sripur virus]|uniref:Uncharacterized protein n=1 Tax=Sripur virus TaxID=1620897 RepID=A0A0D3R1V6_9RHAB|nr:hypothetical protein [Sripur virus]AJR28586.1 hypothetical protein [Sripur virus]
MKLMRKKHLSMMQLKRKRNLIYSTERVMRMSNKLRTGVLNLRGRKKMKLKNQKRVKMNQVQMKGDMIGSCQNSLEQNCTNIRKKSSVKLSKHCCLKWVLERSKWSSKRKKDSAVCSKKMTVKMRIRMIKHPSKKMKKQAACILLTKPKEEHMKPLHLQLSIRKKERKHSVIKIQDHQLMLMMI